MSLKTLTESNGFRLSISGVSAGALLLIAEAAWRLKTDVRETKTNVIEIRSSVSELKQELRHEASKNHEQDVRLTRLEERVKIKVNSASDF